MTPAIGDWRRMLDQAFADEARRGVRLAALARGLAFLLLWASYLQDALENWRNPYFLYRSGLVALALLSGVLTLFAAQRSKQPVPWCGLFLVIDLAVIIALVFGWLPPMISDYPQFMAVRQGDVLLFVVILSASALPLSPRLVIAAGIGSALMWGGAVVHSYLHTPGATLSGRAMAGARGWGDLLARHDQPLVLQTDYLAMEILLLLAIAGLLGFAVAQGRQLVTDTVEAEARRAALARFMPPRVVAALGTDGRLPAERRDAWILFADFDRAAVSTIEQLGAFYANAERVVFEENGVIDRFVGDPLMASFGAIGEAAPDAALRCAEKLLALGGALPVSVAAVHFGPVVSGDVGSERQRAFGVGGDAVNATRRLMDWARGRGLRLTVSAAAGGEHSGLPSQGEANLRGLETPLATWGHG